MNLLEVQDSTTRFGWQGKGRFLPGFGDGIVLDLVGDPKKWAAAYCKNGSLNGWVEQILPLWRQDNKTTNWYKFRFVLSAAFLPPALSILKQRSFIVYNWGDSKGGKTAAMKWAASVWGIPEKLLVSFNATAFALEKLAGFFCDLPLFIDERQLAGANQDFLERMVYMLSNGVGRARGNKEGNVNVIGAWNTVALMTGEEPIAATNSKTGVNTRMVEVQGAPFKDEAAAAAAHLRATDNCGWAGIEFLDWVMKNEDDFKIRHAKMCDEVKALGLTTNGAHLAAISAVSTVSAIVSEIILQYPRELSESGAKEMAESMLTDLKNNELPDVNVSAAQFIVDFIATHPRAFAEKPDGNDWYGWVDDNLAYMFTNPIKEALEKAGFSYRKTIKYLLDNKIINDYNGESTTVKRMGNKTYRVMIVNMKKIMPEGQLSFLTTVDDDTNLPMGW